MEILVFFAAFIYSAASITMKAARLPRPAAVDGLDLTACNGANVSFNWTVDVPPGGQVISAVWLFEPQGQENITLSILINGQFYQQYDKVRLTYLPDAGIQLSNARVENSGRYYVTAQLDVKPGITSFEKQASLTVSDAAPVMQDGQLHVTLGLDVIRDESSGKWTVYLHCGQFLSRGQPPVEAEWITPNGEKIQSAYDEATSSFSLPLEASGSVISGNYTCRLVMTQNATRCLADTNPSMRTEAQLHVDDWDVRLRLLGFQLSYKHNKDGTCDMIHNNQTLKHPAVFDQENAQWSEYRRLQMRVDDIINEEHRMDSRLDNAISLHVELDKRLDDAESQDRLLKDQLDKIVAKNEQLESLLEQKGNQLSEALAKINQQDSLLTEAITKIEQINRQQQNKQLSDTQDAKLNETAVKLELQNKSMAEAVTTIANQSQQLDMLSQQVQEQGKQIQDQAVSLQCQLEYIRRDMMPVTANCIELIGLLPASCAVWKKVNRSSGVRTVLVNKENITVYCDQDTDSGGWTVFQRRVDASVNFYRGWKEYQDGFGNLTGNFWLGLDRLHIITSSRKHELRVDLQMWNGTRGYATYSNFYIDGPAQKYRLHFDNFTGGNAGDSFTVYHRGQMFSTNDMDNDSDGGNCAQMFKGAWWYRYCFWSHLNGDYKPTSSAPERDGLSWKTFGGSLEYSLKFTEMKIRPV